MAYNDWYLALRTNSRHSSTKAEDDDDYNTVITVRAAPV